MSFLYRFGAWLAHWLWLREVKLDESDRAESAAWASFDAHTRACGWCREKNGLCPHGTRLHREWRATLRELEKIDAQDR